MCIELRSVLKCRATQMSLTGFYVWWTPASSSLSLCVSCIYSSWIPFHFDFCLFTPKWTLHQLYFFLQIEKKISLILHTLLEKNCKKKKLPTYPIFHEQVSGNTQFIFISIRSFWSLYLLRFKSKLTTDRTTPPTPQSFNPGGIKATRLWIYKN